MPLRLPRRFLQWSAGIGLHVRLQLFLLLAMLPLGGLTLHLILAERADEIAHAGQRALSLAERGAEQQAEVIRQTRSTLGMLSLIPEVRLNLGNCEEILVQATARAPWSTGFSVLNAKGDLICDSDGGRFSVADRSYFRKAVANREFVVSDYLVGRASGKPVVVALLPTHDDMGRIDRLYLAGVDLRWIGRLAADAADATDGVLTILDRQGTVLAREPSRENVIGRSLATDYPVERLFAADRGILEARGPDGVERILGFATLGETEARIVVTFDKAGVVAAVERSLMFSSGIIAAVVLFATAGIWLLMEVTVLRGLRHLQHVAAGLDHGDHGPGGATAHAPPLSGEFAAIARTFQAVGRELGIQANQDGLTGLANRRRFTDHLARAAASQAEGDGRRLALLFIDLDGFKPVNDRFGHTSGDEVLRQVAARLSASVRNGDLVARFGGDEFCVALTVGTDGQTVAEAAATRIIEAMAEPFVLDGTPLRIGCSIGIAHWPADDADPARVLEHADHALYAAKRAGRNRFVTYATMPSPTVLKIDQLGTPQVGQRAPGRRL